MWKTKVSLYSSCLVFPVDSSYFRHSTFASMSANVSSGKHCIFAGDMNARVGHHVHDLVEGNDVMSYNVIDPTVNENGRSLTRLCKENDLLPVNNLCTPGGSWPSKLTFRRRKKWISEVDLCVVSRTMVSAITSFSANQDLNIPSDHAPMSVSFDFNNVKSNIDLTLIERSSLLGAYPVHEKDGLCRKPIPYHSVDNELFFIHMQQLQPPEVNHNNITESVEVLTETLYNVSSVCKVNTVRPNRKNVHQRKHSSSIWNDY